MKKNVALIIFALLVHTFFALDPLTSGLEAYARADWPSATQLFRKAIADNAHASEPWYWLIMTEIASGQYSIALKDIDNFNNSFKNDVLIADLSYQKGRVLFLTGKYELCIQELYMFLTGWPEHQMVSSAYYWIAEALYAVGRFDESLSIYKYVLDKYPSSSKREASVYRIALIEQGKQSEELLKLLKVSHEESIKIIEEYQRREKTYEQAINAYQKRISDMLKDTRLGDLEKQLGDEKQKNAVLLDKIAQLEIQNADLIVSVSSSGVMLPSNVVDSKTAADLSSEDQEKRLKAIEALRFKAESLRKTYQKIEDGTK